MLAFVAFGQGQEQLTQMYHVDFVVLGPERGRQASSLSSPAPCALISTDILLSAGRAHLLVV